MTDSQPKRMTFDEEILYFDEHPDKITPDALNNFHCHVPGGYTRQYAKQTPFFASKTLMQRIQEGLSSHTGLYSGKRLAQSDSEFYDAIDAALKEANIDSAQIERIIQKSLKAIPLNSRRTASSQRRNRVTKALRRACLPVYRLLREQGYRHYELVQ